MKRIVVWQALLLWLGSIVLTTWIVRQEIALVRRAFADDEPVRYTVPRVKTPIVNSMTIRSPVVCGQDEFPIYSGPGDALTCASNYYKPEPRPPVVFTDSITNSGSIIWLEGADEFIAEPDPPLSISGTITIGALPPRLVVHSDGTLTLDGER